MTPITMYHAEIVSKRTGRTCEYKTFYVRAERDAFTAWIRKQHAHVLVKTSDKKYS